ncbi:MAG: glycogen/starch/alpha-glucan family phosphorylase [Lachnospiraceae bacterium]|nr:glycogen/starch/alpha-glucan family phosphorylase [Lachnospiraceae bacterium]
MAAQSNLQKDVLIMYLEDQVTEIANDMYGKPIADLTDKETYYVVLAVVKRILSVSDKIEGEKKVYYVSMEFLIGKLLSNNLINLGIYEKMKEILASQGKELAHLEELEPEPSLGNGGLGRLAACFLDSIATLGLNGDGVGLLYHFGLFKQVFKDRLQTAEKNNWIEPHSWLNKSEITYDIYFGKDKVTSRLYDIDVIGYEQGVNRLRLFDIESVDEALVKKGITFNKKSIAKNLTLFLYPDDSDEAGNLLRIYQEYFLAANAVQLVFHEMKAKKYDLRYLYNHAVIQINDTHPTLIIPELIRVLVEEKALTIDEAINVVKKTCAYTNHTILAEALEKWPLKYINKVVPQLIPYIKELDKRVKAQYKDSSVHIIDKNRVVHMAHIDIHYGFSVNGVAALHTEILKETELHNFYEIYPDKFNNKTNGITFRRWLQSCNPELSDFITETIGYSFKKDAKKLERLLEYHDKESVLDRIYEIKQNKKCELAAYVKEKEGIVLNENSIFDIQIKRLHEYKRQQMNALYIIHKYLEIKGGKIPATPLTFIFGAKAAPAYTIAQDIIHLLLVLQEIIKNDKAVSPHMTVLMVENYNVSYAEKLIPACDVSEQISLASKEASGTGNMKFMLNGAVTIGTFDGANVEIHELVGDENIYTFGKDKDTVIELYRRIQADEKGKYIAKNYYKNSKIIKKAVDFIVSKKALKVGNEENLKRLYKELLNKDWFMTLLDLEEYIEVKDKMFADYEDKLKWKKMMLVNIAKAGFFSSDRTIAEYNRDIWKL